MIDLDTKKKIAEISKLNAERWKLLCGLAVGAASTVGLVTIFIYCFFIAHFFPTGLKVGDTLFFIFAMLGLSLTGMVLSGFGLMAYVPWISRPPEPPPSVASAAGPGPAPTNKNRITSLLLVVSPCLLIMLMFCVRALFIYKFSTAAATAADIESAALIPFWGALLGAALALIVYGVVSYFLCGGLLNTLLLIVPGALFATFMGLLSLLFPKAWPAVVFAAGLLLGGLCVAMGLDLLDVSQPATVEDLEKRRRKKNMAGVFFLSASLFPIFSAVSRYLTM